jgi:hypothetical protein
VCRCDERLKAKTEDDTRLIYTGLCGGLQLVVINDLQLCVCLQTKKKIDDYYETRKREVKIRLMNEGRGDERLKVRVEESTCLTYTGLNDKTK